MMTIKVSWLITTTGKMKLVPYQLFATLHTQTA